MFTWDMIEVLYKDNKNKDVDFDDLAGEVEFLDRCGVQGMVWPQMASEYSIHFGV